MENDTQSTENENQEASQEELQNENNETTQDNQSQDQNTNDNNDDTKGDEKDADEKKDQEEDNSLGETFETVKDSSGGMYDVASSIQAVTKAETKLEDAKSSQKLDSKEFYSNIDKYLTKEQMELRFGDDTQADYYEAVEKAKEKWEQENSAPIKELEDQVEIEQNNLAIAQAIDSTLKKYPDYNHVKLAKFYNDELTNKEKRALDKGSSFENLPEYFEKIYKLHKEKYPVRVKQKEVPNIPDINTKSKRTIDAEEKITEEKEEKKYLESVGFRKL